MSDITVSVVGQPSISVEVSPLGATGPQGPAGPSAVSDDDGNTAVLGSDDLIFVPEVTKADVGLGNVDNTSDADKPLSDATTSALAGKAATVHTHTSASITDFGEAVQDAVAAMLAEGANISLVYDDDGNTLTVSATGGGGGDAELIRDTIGAAITGLGNISVLIDDDADTITIVTTATVNSTDAALRDRSTHTGTQSADTLTDGTTNKAFLATERTKLAGIATGATANDTDANLKNRANHTGTQLASTISDLTATVSAIAFPFGCAENPHTTQSATRGSLAVEFWKYTGTEGVDDPDHWVPGDEWVND